MIRFVRRFLSLAGLERIRSVNRVSQQPAGHPEGALPVRLVRELDPPWQTELPAGASTSPPPAATLEGASTCKATDGRPYRTAIGDHVQRLAEARQTTAQRARRRWYGVTRAPRHRARMRPPPSRRLLLWTIRGSDVTLAPRRTETSADVAAGARVHAKPEGLAMRPPSRAGLSLSWRDACKAWASGCMTAPMGRMRGVGIAGLAVLVAVPAIALAAVKNRPRATGR